MQVSTARAIKVEQALQQSEGMFRTPRMFEDDGTDAVAGSVHWYPKKSLWISAMTLTALIGGPLYFTWGALALFVVTTAITVCLGHSLGMHRRLVHRSYDCPLWVERLFVYLGTIVGLAGPFGIIRQHDIRDWAQRKPQCHPFLAHRNPIWKDGYWQLHCELRLDHPPQLEMEPQVANDKFYQRVERFWMAQQLPWAVLFYWIGGMPWVVWGIAARVTASVTGHWLVGYFAHNEGLRNWHVDGAGVQGYNVPSAGFITFGEAWHNNHHAFPASARLGLKDGESDPGWWVLKALERLGLVSNLKTPDVLPARPSLVSLVGRSKSFKNAG
jgi:fatty-acid desaturase